MSFIAGQSGVLKSNLVLRGGGDHHAALCERPRLARFKTNARIASLYNHKTIAAENDIGKERFTVRQPQANVSPIDK